MMQLGMLGQQELLQLRVFGLQPDAGFLFIQQGFYRIGERDGGADDGFDHVVEFYGVGGLEEETFFVRVLGEIPLQCEEADGAVRVGEVMVVSIEIADAVDGFNVGDADGGENFL